MAFHLSIDSKGIGGGTLLLRRIFYFAESEVSFALPFGTISSSVNRVAHFSRTVGSVVYSMSSVCSL